jgi:hypothetical protein
MARLPDTALAVEQVCLVVPEEAVEQTLETAAHLTLRTRHPPLPTEVAVVGVLGELWHQTFTPLLLALEVPVF